MLEFKHMQILENKTAFKIVIISIFLVATLLRAIAFDQIGGDHETFKQTVAEFMAGINPYEYTVLSYQREDLKHGYAYMPTLLYLQTFLVRINGVLKLDLPTIYLWKCPVLLADIGVGFLIYKILKEKNYPKLITIIGLFFWFFNPYFLMRYEYTNYESLPVFFLLLSLMTIGKKDLLSGMLFALAVTFKTFPLILLSALLLRSKNIKLFLLGGFFVVIAISFPFFRSAHDLDLMIRGSFLVHGERGIQGRPLFSFLTYYLQRFGVNFFQPEFSKIYTATALIGSQILPLYLYFKKKINNIWVLSLASFAVYYLFVPVLNRTHLIWGTPFVYLGLLEIYEGRLNKYYLVISIYYLLLCIYYFFWDKGLKNPLTFGGQIWIEPVFEDKSKFPLINDLYVKAVQWKKSVFN